MSKRTTKKFNSKFYGIDFYGYEHINKVSEKEPINCELRGQITKEIVKKMQDNFGFMSINGFELDNEPGIVYGLKGLMPRGNVEKAKAALKEDNIYMSYERYTSVKFQNGEYLFSGWRSKVRTKIKPEDLPESYVELHNYKKHGYLETAGVADVAYKPCLFDNHAFKDDFLCITYKDKSGKMFGDKSELDELTDASDEYIFGNDILRVVEGIVKNNPDNQELQKKILKIKERMVEKYNTYVEEENRKWNHGLKKVDSFEELFR